MVATLPRRGVDRAIRGYQRYVSPRKGYNCAYLIAQGERSCSAVIRGFIAEQGILRAMRPTMIQFAACYQAAMLLSTQNPRVQGVCCCGGIPIPFRF